MDLKHRHLKVFREPQDGDYASPIILSGGEIRPLAFPDIAVSVRRLLEA